MIERNRQKHEHGQFVHKSDPSKRWILDKLEKCSKELKR